MQHLAFDLGVIDRALDDIFRSIDTLAVPYGSATTKTYCCRAGAKFDLMVQRTSGGNQILISNTCMIKSVQ